MYYVYCHTAPSGKRYIGQTGKNPKKRWDNGKGYSKSPYFKLAIEKYGWENIKHEILSDKLTKEEADVLETYYIRKFQTTNPHFGYNLSAGGSGGAHPNPHTKEWNKKIADKLTGNQNSAGLKRCFTEEHRIKLSEAKKGNTHGAANKGKKHTAETRQQISKAMKGKKMSAETVLKMTQAQRKRRAAERELKNE